MTLKSEIQNLLKRFKLQSTTSDVVAVESLIDRISPPVPISASFLLYTTTQSATGNIQSLIGDLGYSVTIDSKSIKNFKSFFVLVTINRGTYWGDCNLSMIAPPEFSVVETSPSISQNETQTAIAFTFVPNDVAGKYTAVFQLDCDGVIISRTLEITVQTESNYGDYGYGNIPLGGNILK
jgi:hypothetical protein